MAENNYACKGKYYNKEICGEECNYAKIEDCDIAMDKKRLEHAAKSGRKRWTPKK